MQKNADVAVEYVVTPTQHRIDAVIGGLDGRMRKSIVIIELKQWSEVSPSDLQYFVYANIVGSEEGDTWHPSYQAANYAGILCNFNQYVQDKDVRVSSCSFLHNMPEARYTLLGDMHLYPQVRKSPVFLKEDYGLLAEYINDRIIHPDPELLDDIECSPPRPSPKLAEMLYETMKGKEFFSYSDTQALIVSKIVSIVEKAMKIVDGTEEKRTIVFIEGGPGTGKSIIAINVLSKLLNYAGGAINSAYFTANAAPRNYYKKQLIHDDYERGAIKGLFRSPLTLKKDECLTMGCALVDEAHRMYASHYRLPANSNPINNIIRASRVSVFFH